MLRQIILGSAVLFLLGCDEASESKTVSIAGNHWLGYQPYFLAFDHRQTASSDLLPVHLSMQDSTTTVMRLMSNDRIDGAFLTLDEALQLQSDTGLDLCVSQIIDYSFGADAMLADPESFPPSASQAFRVAFESTALGRYMYKRAVEELKLDSVHVIPVSLEPAEQLMALKEGRVQAVITYEPYISAALDIGAETVFSSDQIPGEIVDVLVFKQSVWEDHSQALTEFLEELWSQGVGLIHSPSNSVAEQLGASTGLTGPHLNRALEGIHFVSTAENRVLLNESLPRIIDRMSESLSELSMLSTPPILAPCR